MSNEQLHPLIPLGVGVAIGGGALWLAFKIWPAIIIVVGAWLVMKGIGRTNSTKVGNEQ